MTTHTIIMIEKDKKYLQYYDERWNSLLFPNTKVIDGTKEEIIKECKKKYDLELSNLTLVFDHTHTKYSESHKEFRQYHHIFYEATLEKENPKYEYYTIEELEKNKRVMEVNKDIIDFIKERKKANS